MFKNYKKKTIMFGSKDSKTIGIPSPWELFYDDMWYKLLVSPNKCSNLDETINILYNKMTPMEHSSYSHILIRYKIIGEDPRSCSGIMSGKDLFIRCNWVDVYNSIGFVYDKTVLKCLDEKWDEKMSSNEKALWDKAYKSNIQN